MEAQAQAAWVRRPSAALVIDGADSNTEDAHGKYRGSWRRRHQPSRSVHPTASGRSPATRRDLHPLSCSTSTARRRSPAGRCERRPARAAPSPAPAMITCNSAHARVPGVVGDEVVMHRHHADPLRDAALGELTLGLLHRWKVVALITMPTRRRRAGQRIFTGSGDSGSTPSGSSEVTQPPRARRRPGEAAGHQNRSGRRRRRRRRAQPSGQTRSAVTLSTLPPAVTRPDASSAVPACASRRPPPARSPDR